MSGIAQQQEVKYQELTKASFDGISEEQYTLIAKELGLDPISTSFDELVTAALNFT